MKGRRTFNERREERGKGWSTVVVVVVVVVVARVAGESGEMRCYVQVGSCERGRKGMCWWSTPKATERILLACPRVPGREAMAQRLK